MNRTYAPSRKAVAAIVATSLAMLMLLTGSTRAPRAEAAGSLRFKTVQLKEAGSGTEPRIAVGPRNWRWAITNDAATNDAVVYKSKDGLTWTRTKTEPAGQVMASIDVDIVRTAGGRSIATELDYGGINFRTSYTDNGGKTWTASTGAQLGDTDRQWLAVGPKDPTTHKPRVYLMFHNLASGTANHNMYVQTSNDGGETFDPPVPITLPGDEAYLDLQCSDSGGPSSITVNKKTGRIYAVWGTRHSVAGGCAAQPPEANVVAATRVWVATSKDNSAGSWKTSLAVDRWKSGQVVGMQLAPGALDTQGNIYVVYPQSPHAYPDYTGAAINYRWAPPNLSKWSKPVTVAAKGGAGNVLPHIVVGAPGKIDFAWFKGKKRPGDKPAWYTTVAQTLNGLSAHPSFTRLKVSRIPTYTGTASELMGVCSNPGGGFTCPRSTDVWGIDLDLHCRLMITWPTVPNNADGAKPGTFVSTQKGGQTVCGSKHL
jgi:hypothetical protein